MHRADKYPQHSSIIWPVWLNDWVFVYKLSSCGFESRCSHLVHLYICAATKQKQRAIGSRSQSLKLLFLWINLFQLMIRYIQEKQIKIYKPPNSTNFLNFKMSLVIRELHYDALHTKIDIWLIPKRSKLHYINFWIQ